MPKVIEAIQSFAGTIYYTRDTHTADYLKTLEGQKLPIEHCIKDTTGWELQKDIGILQKKQNAQVIDKLSFGSLQLVDSLVKENEKNPISSITLIGLCTDICVISNALAIKTALFDTPIFVNASCCAGVTPQSHLNAIEAMKMCQIDIIE